MKHITRTFTITNVTASVYNIDTKEVKESVYKLDVNVTQSRDKFIKDITTKIESTDNVKVLEVIDTETVPILMGMSVEEFLKHSVVYNNETHKPEQQETDMETVERLEKEVFTDNNYKITNK